MFGRPQRGARARYTTKVLLPRGRPVAILQAGAELWLRTRHGAPDCPRPGAVPNALLDETDRAGGYPQHDANLRQREQRRDRAADLRSGILVNSFVPGLPSPALCVPVGGEASPA